MGFLDKMQTSGGECLFSRIRQWRLRSVVKTFVLKLTGNPATRHASLEVSYKNYTTRTCIFVCMFYQFKDFDAIMMSS
jgi:hypothetical protein